MSQDSIWAAGRPTSTVAASATALHGLWGVGALFGGFASSSRWGPSRVLPVQRTNTAVVTKRELSHARRGRVDVRRSRRRLAAVLDARRAHRRPAALGPSSAVLAVGFARAAHRLPHRSAPDRRRRRRIDRDARRVRRGRPAGVRGSRATRFISVRTEHDVLFVIGGIGVTPILPMIRAARATRMN